MNKEQQAKPGKRNASGKHDKPDRLATIEEADNRTERLDPERASATTTLPRTCSKQAKPMPTTGTRPIARRLHWARPTRRPTCERWFLGRGQAVEQGIENPRVDGSVPPWRDPMGRASAA